MSTICFVSYEIHPTTFGGCGVLIHHAAEKLLAKGHRVVFLLDLPAAYFKKFVEVDRLTLPRPELVSAYRVDDLCESAPTTADVPNIFQLKSARFAHALDSLLKLERIDFVEFFEYCGSGYASFVRRLFEPGAPGRAVIGCRMHGSIEVLDTYGQGSAPDLDRYVLHAIERRAMDLAEVALTPSRTYYEQYYKDRYRLEAERTAVSSPPKQDMPRLTRRPVPGEPLAITAIGRLAHLKGFDQLVHAGVQLLLRRPELACTFLIIGNDSAESPVPGSYRAYLESLIPAALRPRFVFTGQLSHDTIMQRLEHTLIGVFPNRTESFCYALHEVYDAGVPVVANNLPAFRDFFTHERNALLYDGTTPALVSALERLIDDARLRERLSRPYAVADAPLGSFYDQPVAARPLDEVRADRSIAPEEVLVLIVGGGADSAAVRSLREQSVSVPNSCVVLLNALESDGGRHTEESMWFLGRAWRTGGVDGAAGGQRFSPSSLRTSRALLVLDANDRLDPSWLELCLRALSRRPEAAFAGTWCRRGDEVVPYRIDLAPELEPFNLDPRTSVGMPRVLLQTQPGIPLSDLCEPALGPLGLLARVWDRVAATRHGVIYPSPLFELAPEPCIPINAEASHIAALLMQAGAPFAERLRLASGILHAQPRPEAQPLSSSAPELTVGDKIAAANDLGGSLLMRMAVRKMLRRLKRRP